MGLRFRRSVTLCKGVRLNFGKNGMSISAGTKGYRKTYSFATGRTTTSVGIPGSGLSYVTTSSGNRANRSHQAGSQRPTHTYEPNNIDTHPDYDQPAVSAPEEVPRDAFIQQSPPNLASIMSASSLTSIHFSSDDKLDWTEMLIQDAPPEECGDVEFWKYCHDKAYDVLNGSIDTYLQIIQDVGPLDDLLEYGFGFECGTDNPNKMFVEFEAKQDEILPDRALLDTSEYNDLLQDYICSCSIRVARDIFALLPVSHVIVHAVSDGSTVLSVDFERRIFTKMKFHGSDASNLVENFKHNMNFDCRTGFQPVAQLEG